MSAPDRSGEHPPEPQHDHQWVELTSADPVRGYAVQQCTIPYCGVKRDVSDEADTTSDAARVLAENSPCIWSIAEAEHPYGKDFCLDEHPDKHPGVGFCWVLPTKQAKALAEAGLLREDASKHVGKLPGTLYVQIEVTPHDWATRGEGWEAWNEATPEQAVRALRDAADRWAREYGLEVAPSAGDCGSCAACDPGMMLDGQYMPLPSRMNVCPDCGNKRCPKATNHVVWQCSGSNAVGQVGVREQADRADALERETEHRDCAPLDSMRHASDAANRNHKVSEKRLQAIERVRALHQPPEAASPATRLHGMCLECSRPDHEGNPGLLHPWPCETVSMLGTTQ